MIKHFRQKFFSFLSVICIVGYSSSATAAEPLTITALQHHLDFEDKLVLNDIYKKIKIIVGKSTVLNDPDLRNTDEKMSVNTDIEMRQFTTENFLQAKRVIQTQLGGKLLQDNAKGASIYCLGNKQTFEIHQPLSLSKRAYDMNDPKENRGVFKIIQLNNTWNISMTTYKNVYDACV